MTLSNRLSNAASMHNAWRDVVRGCSLSKDSEFCAPTLGLGYQPERIQKQVHSGRKGLK